MLQFKNLKELMIRLSDEKNKKDGFKKFFLIRHDFETFLIRYKTLINQVVIKYGSGLKSYLKLESLFSYIIDFLEINKNDNNKREEKLLQSLKDNFRIFISKT